MSEPEIIERPCTTCGIPLEKGVKIVAAADVISGCAFLIIWSVVLSLVLNNPPEPFEDNGDPNLDYYKITHLQHESEMGQVYYNLEVDILIALVIFSVIQILFGFLLYYGQAKKSTLILNTWLVVSGFSIPANGLLIKIYEMIVVFSFADEIKCEMQAEAMEEFRQLPYVCVMETQWYPEAEGWERDRKDDNDSYGRKYGMAFHQSKHFLVNAPPETMFSTVHHYPL